MPPPEEKPLPLPRPKPKPPKPKPRPEPGAARPRPEPERDGKMGDVPLPPDPFACAKNCSEECAYFHLCPLAPPPPPTPAATVHLRSSRLPTPLIALSASLLAVSAVLLLALLVHRLVRRRRRRQAAPQEAPMAQQHDEEGGQVLAAVAEEGEEEEELDDGDGGVHHVWYIRTKGLDERAIASIAVVVYDAKKRGGSALGGDGDDGGCAVCLAEFRDGETLRLLPRCRHAFHRGCIDTWLRAHINCPLCRAPVQVAAAAVNSNAAPGVATATPRGAAEPNLGAVVGGAQTVDTTLRGVPAERAVRRAASMVALPRRAWPDVSVGSPASNSGREEEMTGLSKIRRLLKLSEALEMAGVGVGRSISFGAGSCHHLPARSGPSAAGVNDENLPQ
ncbi:hypothetical protein ACP70R_007630 [Stipagrostis hirtigluma subsp. patula]